MDCEETKTILYLCDGCEDKCELKSDVCRYTSNISHAKNFRCLAGIDIFVEMTWKEHQGMKFEMKFAISTMLFLKRFSI